MAKPSPSHAGVREQRDLGAAIRARRVEMGLSQEALAAIAEVDRSYMGGLERGEHNPTVMTVIRVATALDVRLSSLLKVSDI